MVNKKKKNEKNKVNSNKDRKHNRKFNLCVFIIILGLLFLVLSVNYYFIISEKTNNDKQILDKNEKIKDISSHYSNFVKTTSDVNLYTFDGDNYVKSGMFGSDQVLSLGDIEINENTIYFPVLGYSDDFYVSYSDVIPIYEETVVDDSRYKKYVPFGEVITTKNPTNFYSDGKLVLRLDKSLEFNIIIKEENSYFVLYNNRLLEILKDDVDNISKIGEADSAKKVRVVAYHSFYDENEESESWCRNSICHNIKQFDGHLKYLKDNNYFTLTMDELEMFIDGKINIPKNSVVITIDDGLLAERAIQLLNNYELNGTVFLITSYYSPDNYERGNYVEFHSHGHNLHKQYVCPGGQGGGIKCLDEQTLLDDLAKSSEILNGSKVFCYPFYEFNDYSIKVLKEAGYKMAFAGLLKDGFVRRGTDKYRIPRYTITSDVTINEFINILK